MSLVKSLMFKRELRSMRGQEKDGMGGGDFLLGVGVRGAASCEDEVVFSRAE